MKISVLLPTRGRTQTLLNSIKSLLDRADNPNEIEVLLAMDRDDVESMSFARQHLLPLHDKIYIYEFDRLGYKKINMYVNSLAGFARGYWLLMWGDDALMNTSGWDTVVDQHREHPMPFLRMPSENFDHPFALFPIIKKIWFEVAGTISYQIHYDRFLYNVARNICEDILINIPVTVIHDRADLTGNNRDETFENAMKSYVETEGNPADPYNDDYPTNLQVTFHTVNKLKKYINETFGYEIPLIDVTKEIKVVSHTAQSHKV
jgi:hypothetical protein